MSILHIQEYLRSGKSLLDLTIEYNINAFDSIKYLNLVAFDYTALSPKTEAIVREARGLILEKNTYNLVARSMNAFSFNSDGSFNDIYSSFDWNTAKAYPKYDGCLIILYHYKGEWLTGTRFSVDGLCNVASAFKKESDITWSKLFKDCLNFINIDFDAFTETLNKNYSYSFELCSVVNRNIVLYENKFVKLLSIYDNQNNQEVSIHEDKTINEQWSQIVPYFIPVKDVSDVEHLLSLNQDPTQNEGLVVVDQYYHRLKFRNPNFDKLSYKINPADEVTALRELFFQIMNALSPTSSGTPTVATYCFYDTNGTGYCIDPSMSSGYNGPYASCSLSGDCVVDTYCWYDANNIYQSVCVPLGGTVPNPSGSNFVATGGKCGISPCVNPINGGGSGPMSIMSTEGLESYKICASTYNPKNKNINTNFVAMCNWIISEYKNYKMGNLDSKIKIQQVWIEAFNTLENNKPLISLVSLENVKMCKEAIERYKSTIMS
jgi:hypothetical protein